jgi:hypothetical protein
LKGKCNARLKCLAFKGKIRGYQKGEKEKLFPLEALSDKNHKLRKK